MVDKKTEAINEILIAARKNQAIWWNWYNGLTNDQRISHYTRHHGQPRQQQYHGAIKKLASIKQIIKEENEARQ